MAAWDEAPSPDSPEGRAVLSGTAPKTAQQIWDEAPTISGPKTAEGFWQNVQAAIEGTGTSMLLTQKLPEFQPSDPKTTPWYIRVPSQLAGLAADAPAMAIGAVAGLGGGPAAPVMAGAGMMAAPAVLREAMTDYLQGKDVNLWELIKTGAKEGAIGGLTFGVGAKLRGVMPGASDLMTSAAQNTGRTAYLTARGAAIAGAEAATMTGSRGVLEWRVPDAHEWIDSALVIGAMHGVNYAVPRVVSKLQDTWSKTGVPPERIAEDAAVNPEIRHDLMDEFRPIPRAYEHLIEPKAPPVVEELQRVPADPALVTRIQETNKAAEDAVKALPKEEGTAKGERVEITVIGGKVSGDATVAEVRAAQDKAEGKPPEKPQPLLEAEKAVDPADVVIPEPALKDLPTDGKIPIENTGGKNLNVSSVKNAEEAMRELQRHVEENQKTFKEAKGDTIAEAETVKAASEWLNNVYGRDGITDKAGVEVSSAELVGRKRLMVQSATALSNFGREIHAQRAKGVPITVEQQARYLELKADLDVKASLFTKQSAEAGRILRALQIKIGAERDRAVLAEVERQGGAKTLESFLTILATVGDAATVVKVMKPATMLGKILEFWKAGLISGPWTWGINLAANVTQTAFRVPISVTKAALGTMRKGEDRVLFAELIGEAYGMARGGLDGVIAAGKLLRHLDESVTANMSVGEGHVITPQIGKGYIPGIHLGSIVRYPFRLLTAGDLIFKGMHESATAHAMAYRRAIEREGAHDNIHEAAQKYLKDPDILAAAEASGKKYTFTTELAPFGKAMAGVLREAPVLQFVLPFWRTPANIFKESAMFVPGVNLLMREQRAAVRKGGEAADQVYAQMIVGGAVMGAVWALVDARYITGGGDPDPKARATQTAAGMVPYSIMGKDVSQLGSFGTILSLAADLNIMSQYMTAGEMEHAGRMLGFAMTQQVMNKTSLQGLAKFFAAMAQPYQKFDKFWEQLVASFVPGIVSQVAGGSDDYIREVHSFADAIRNRIPGLRNGLFPKNDLFGEPIPTFDHLWGVLPIKSRLLTNDPVRLEAARLGILTPDIEEQMDAVPGKLVGKVELTPQQMDTFSAGSGKMAYEGMKERMLGANGQITPDWEELPDQVKKQLFNKAFTLARRKVKAQVLEPNTEAAAEKAYADFFKEIRNKTFNVRVPGKEKQ